MLASQNELLVPLECSAFLFLHELLTRFPLLTVALLKLKFFKCNLDIFYLCDSKDPFSFVVILEQSHATATFGHHDNELCTRRTVML